MITNFSKNVETQRMAVNGWNWGKVSFGGKRDRFEMIVCIIMIDFSW